MAMWYKSYKKVDGIVIKTGPNYDPKFEFNFEKLAEITNHYDAFIEKVKATYEKDGATFMDIAVFIDEEPPYAGELREGTITKIYVVFDHSAPYISLFGCDSEHEKYPRIYELSYNKKLVSMMADLLPVETPTKKEIDKYMTVPEAADIFNIPVETIKNRLKPSIKTFSSQLIPMIEKGLIKSYLKRDGKRKEWIISEDAMKIWFFSEKE